MANKKVKEVEEVVKEVETTISEVINSVEAIPENIKDDEVYVPNKGLIKLKPTKLKYFKDGSYNNYLLVKNMGINELLRFDDGIDVIRDYLAAVFDCEKSTIDFIDEMSTKDLYNIIDKANKINEIKDTDFLTQMQGLGVVNEE